MLMTTPTAAQEAAAAASGGMSIVGAHSIGVADGGPSLPIVGWSTEGGDQRAPHFVGLHALQILPFLEWILSVAGGAWLAMRHRATMVWVFGLAYLGLLLLLTWQATRGQSVVAPDAVTLGLLAAGVLTTSVAALGIVLHARRTAHVRPRGSISGASIE